jgi:hypothetical protein
MSSGHSLFKRPSVSTPASPITSHLAAPSSSTLVTPEDSSEPRRRQGSAPLTSAFGLMRREPAPSTSTSSSRMNFADTTPPSPKRLPDLAQKSSALLPKRKTLAKDPAFDKLNSSHEDSDLNGKLGKMELGSTMVWIAEVCADRRLLESVCAVILTYDFLLQSLVIGVPCACASMTSSQTSHDLDSSLSP